MKNHPWIGASTTGFLDSRNGIIVTHEDGSTAYVPPGEHANDLGATLDQCGDDMENIDGLLCDALEAFPAPAQELYDALPVTATPSEFLCGHGNWGLTEDESKLATHLANIIELES